MTSSNNNNNKQSDWERLEYLGIFILNDFMIKAW